MNTAKNQTKPKTPNEYQLPATQHNIIYTSSFHTYRIVYPVSLTAKCMEFITICVSMYGVSELLYFTLLSASTFPRQVLSIINKKIQK